MTFLPVVARELRVASRRRATYWLRCGAAGSVIFAGTWIFVMMQSERQSPREIAAALFYMLTGCAAFFSLFSGIRATADCLSSEKREGTLGLLFLTDLKGYDVVLGKLVAGSVNSAFALAAVVPVLGVPVLLGGLTLGEFGRMALVVMNALFLSLTIGIAVSAMSRAAQKAVGLTFLLALTLLALVPACGALLAYRRNTSIIEPGFLLPSPGYTYWMAVALNYTGHQAEFWQSLSLVHGMGWLALGLACLVAPRSWQDRPLGVRRLRWRERWQYLLGGARSERAQYRRALLAENAFYWLSSRARLKPVLVWLLLGSTAGLWAWGLWKFHREWLDPVAYVLTAIWLNIALRVWLANEAVRQLAEERKAGTLELLLCTPLSVREILRGQGLSLQRQFLGPVLIVLVLELAFMLAGLRQIDSGDRGLWLAVWPAGMVMFVADLFALYWVAMWQGLTAKTISHASAGTLVRVLFLPWGGFGLVMMTGGLLSLAGRTLPNPEWQFFLALWFTLGLAADVGFGSFARHKLLNEFRLAAQERYSTRASFWQRLWRGRSTGPERRVC